MITADTITNDDLHDMLCKCYGHADDGGAFCVLAAMSPPSDLFVVEDVRRRARARCAEILNTMRGAK